MRLGINVHPVYSDEHNQTRAYSAEEKTALDTFLVQAQPDAILVMNDFGWAVRFAEMLPDTNVVFRLYNKDIEGELWKHLSPAEYFMGMLGYRHPRIILSLGNEPDGNLPIDELKKMVAWYVAVMGLFHNTGIAIAIPSWSTGQPDLRYFMDDLAWDALKPLFEAFKAFPEHFLASHSYFNKETISEFHVGRHAKMAAAIQARGYKVPSWLITEYAGENLDGVPGRFKTAYGANDTGEDLYASRTLQGLKMQVAPYIEGIIVYQWGCYPGWQDTDISKAKRYQSAVIGYNRAQMPLSPPPVVIHPPAPLPPVAQLPAELGTPVNATISSQWLLFADASSSSPIIGTLKDGEHIKQYPQTVRVVETMKYYVVERENVPAGEAKIGWSSFPVLVSTPKPEPPPLPPLKDTITLTSAEYDRLVSVISQLEAEIAAKINVLRVILEDASQRKAA